MTSPEERELAAAEFALGTLDGDERREMEELRRADGVLDQAIEAWHARLSPLAEAAGAVDPSDDVYRAILARLFSSDVSSDVVVAFRGRLRRWQALSAGLAALAACLIAWIVVRPATETQAKFVAVLQSAAGQPALLVNVDIRNRALSVRPFDTSVPAGKSLELWLIDATLGAPRSLGIFSERGQTRASLSPFDPAVIEGATYAVTLEPAGGSPTGAPSGKPILVGHLSPAQ